MPLRSTQQDLTVETTKDVVIADVAVVGACDEVSHAEGGCKGVGGDGMRDGADGFDGVGARVGEGGQELVTPGEGGGDVVLCGGEVCEGCLEGCVHAR